MQRLFPLLIFFLFSSIVAWLTGYSTVARILILVSLMLATFIGGSGQSSSGPRQKPGLHSSPGPRTPGQHLLAIEASVRGETWTPPLTDFDDRTVELGRRRAGPGRIE